MREDTSRSRNLLKQNSEGSKTLRIVNTLGNIKETTSELLKEIKCTCGNRKDLEVIVMAFAEKIEKIRQERNKCKARVKELKEANELLQLEKNGFQGLRSLDQESEGSRGKDRGEGEHRLQLKIRYLEEELRQERQEKQQRSREPFEEAEVVEENAFLKKANLELQRRVGRLEEDLARAEAQVSEAQARARGSEKPGSLRSKEELEMWDLANRLGEQAWQRRLELEIKQLCEKKEGLRQAERQLKERGGCLKNGSRLPSPRNNYE
jgi:hypothetical protein